MILKFDSVPSKCRLKPGCSIETTNQLSIPACCNSEAVAGAGLAFAVKRLLADQGAQADRTSEYYDCPLRLLGSADDDALLQFDR